MSAELQLTNIRHAYEGDAGRVEVLRGIRPIRG